MKHILTIFFLFILLLSFSQEDNTPYKENRFCTVIPSEDDNEWEVERTEIVNRSNKTEEINKARIIKINFHIMQKEDGTGSFTTTGSAQDNYLSGYQFIKDLMKELNNQQSQNLAKPLRQEKGNKTYQLKQKLCIYRV